MIEKRLQDALENAAKEVPSLTETDYSVIRRARRRIAFASGALSLAVIGAIGGLSVMLLGETGSEGPVPPAASPANGDSVTGEESSDLIEEMTEQERAEVFAFRALAAKDLMGPFHKRSYNFTYDDDTEPTGEGEWSVGFAASDCEPRSEGFTCRGLSGDDPKLGNALTDTYVVVRIEDGAWEVVGVEGNMLAEERERVVRYSLPDRSEPSHWEFPAADLWHDDGEPTVSMIPVWVGPYPTKARGSVCTVQAMGSDGQAAGRPTVFYQEPPDRAFERAGWVRSGGVHIEGDAESVEVECSQYTGRVWEQAGDPQMARSDGKVVAITAELVWRGDEGFTTAASCRATLVDDSGAQVWEGTGRVETLWRPDELDNYPYRTNAVVTTGGEPIEAESIGEFSCTSL